MYWLMQKRRRKEESIVGRKGRNRARVEGEGDSKGGRLAATSQKRDLGRGQIKENLKKVGERRGGVIRGE